MCELLCYSAEPMPAFWSTERWAVALGRQFSHQEKFVSFTLDTGELPSGYSDMDMESPDVLALVSAVAPAYIRLSGGRADSMGFKNDAAAVDGYDSAISAATRSVGERAKQHCVGDDCGNCDAANSLGGAPPKALPAPTLWFNKSAWDRVNRMAAATNMEIIFGTKISFRRTLSRCRNVA